MVSKLESIQYIVALLFFKKIVLNFYELNYVFTSRLSYFWARQVDQVISGQSLYDFLLENY